MLLFPVLKSVLGVLWHREHLATISRDDLAELEDDDEELSEELESSLTSNTFCTG